MADLVVCCDGTWQVAVDRSNVALLYEALDDSLDKHYVPGVGTGDLLDRIRGGITAAGLSRSLIDGYTFLVEKYRPGDRISVFGFSRGAYTARSLAGMVGTVGIIDPAGLDDRARSQAIHAAYQHYSDLKATKKARAGQDDPADPPPAPASNGGPRLSYDPTSADTPIEFVGVWDTVGALGIPTYVGVPDVLHSRERYEFFNVVLDPRILHGRHAVSLDEMRGPFRPTLWDENDLRGQDIEQVWFPGDHCDVGGGHRDDTSLSDGALEWMIEQAITAIGLPFKPDFAAKLSPEPTGPLHTMATGLIGAVEEIAFQPRPRATPPIDHTDRLPSVSDSAYQRQQAALESPYRPTRTLTPGQTAQVTIAADHGWNATGLYLEAGHYVLDTSGTWRTGVSQCGPDGIERARVLSAAFTSSLGSIESGLRALLADPDVEVLGARREIDQPLMMAMARVTNEVSDNRGTITDADQRFAIGLHLEIDVRRPGYLYAYANDAWGFYGNNSGAVTIEITRA